MENLLKLIFKTDTLNESQQIIVKIVPMIISICVAIIVIKYIVKLAGKIITKSKIPKSAHVFVVTSIKIVLYFLLIISICSHLGIDITSLIAAFSIVGVAISLSIQNTLGNVMAGISLLFTKQFGIDDFVEAGGISGSVKRIGLFNCKLRTPDGKDIYVPNSNIIADTVTNYTREPKRRVDITIGTSYSENIDKVKEALLKVINDTPEVLKNEDIFYGITSFEESSVNYTIRVWVKNQDYWKAYLPMLERLKRTFEECNIEIPFNQLDVHIKKDN